VDELGHVNSKVVVALLLPQIVGLFDGLVGLLVVEFEVSDEVVLDVLHRAASLNSVLLPEELYFVGIAQAHYDGSIETAHEVGDFPLQREERWQQLGDFWQQIVEKENYILGCRIVEAINTELWLGQVVGLEHSVEDLVDDLVVAQAVGQQQGQQQDD
jgi:hypothetical protein